MARVAQRQSVNIATDLSNANNRQFNVGLSLRFVPHEVIVRSVVYSNTGAADTLIAPCQLVSNIVDDQVLTIFSSGVNSTQQQDNTFTFTRQVQQGSFGFQVQLAPTAATGYTGGGDLVPATVQGRLAVQLEFIQYE